MSDQRPLLIDNGAAFDTLGLVHRVRVPDGAPPYPTVVMVHGRAGNEDVAWVFEKALPANWLLISPRAPYVDPLRGFSWNVQDSDDEGWSTLDDFAPAVAAFDQFMSGLPEAYGVDLSNTHFLGFSQGCALLYAYAMQYPEKVQCLSALVGFMPAGAEHSPLLANLKDKRVFMAVGRKDTTIPMTQAHRCARLLIEGGVQLDYREYETGHKLNRAGMQGLQQWWTQVERMTTGI